MLLTRDVGRQLLVVGLPQQPDQSGNAVTVLDGDLVVWVFAVGNVLQRSAGSVVDLRSQQRTKRDARFTCMDSEKK